MRTRLKNSAEVFHVWAQQSQYEGRAATVFFRGRSIFSYGEHFEMARFVTPELVLFTTRRYSVTTSGHIHAARVAVSHKTVFTVPTFDDHNANALYLVNQVKEEIEKTKRARTSINWHIEQVDESIKTARAYVETFKKSIKAENRKEVRILDAYRAKHLPNLLLITKLEKETEWNAKEAERRSAAQKRNEEYFRKLQLAQSERLELWLKGEYSGPLGWNVPTLLRIKGRTIQTTLGAEIPLIEAGKFWKAFRENSGSVVGMRLGHFTVDAVEVTDNTTGPDIKGTLRVGCHSIPLEEIYKLAKALNWYGAEVA